jgi:hypothetical protein
MIRSVTRQGTTLGDLVDVHAATLVTLRDVWGGMSKHSPIAAVYELRRGATGALTGEGKFSTGLVAPKAVRISIRASTAKNFLDALGRARMTRGKYEPYMGHTDDFPNIEIGLHVGAAGGAEDRVARLYTTSQGEFHTPWGATVAGASYTIAGEEIGRALRAVQRSLKRGELERMLGR